MHKTKLLTILLLSLAARTSAQSYSASGDWIGNIVEPNHTLTIYYHITGDPAAGYKGDWSSLQELALGLRLKSVSTSADSLTITMNGVPAIFKGKYYTADSISGTWLQGGRSTALNLARVKRSQTPLPPFPYRTDSVEYDSPFATVHLGATLSLPAKGKKFPAVILITGSGQQDRDETIFGHKPFAVIADYLTRRGIAVLRVDDRGIGRSTGDLSHATTEDFAGDVLASIRYLQTRPDIDTTRIGLIGHSEGGLIAPIVYTRWPHLKFLVLLAGTGIPGSRIMLRQQTDPLLPISRAAYDAYYPFVKDKLAIINATYGQPDSITLNLLKTSFSRWKSALPDSIATILHTKNATPELFAFQERAELKPWLRYFYATDPATFLSQVHCPVLALNGEKDSQVSASENIPAIKAALAHSGAPADTIVFPGMNHLFQHCQTGLLPEYALIGETFAPEVLSAIGDWTRKILTL